MPTYNIMTFCQSITTSIKEVRHNILLNCLVLCMFFIIFAPGSIKSSHLWMDSPTEFWKPRWSVRCGSNIIHFKNIPCYATAHLLHQVCSALRRHANPRVSNRFQRPGAEPRLLLYASVPRPGTHRRVPASRHRYYICLRWQDHLLCQSRQI